MSSFIKQLFSSYDVAQCQVFDSVSCLKTHMILGLVLWVVTSPGSYMPLKLFLNKKNNMQSLYILNLPTVKVN